MLYLMCMRMEATCNLIRIRNKWLTGSLNLIQWSCNLIRFNEKKRTWSVHKFRRTNLWNQKWRFFNRKSVFMHYTCMDTFMFKGSDSHQYWKHVENHVGYFLATLARTVDSWHWHLDTMVIRRLTVI